MLRKIILSFTMLSSTTVFSGAMETLDTFKQSAYIKLGSGGSFSMNSNVKANPIYWDASPQGYNATVGNTALYSAAFGYNYSTFFSGDIEYIYRPSYAYSKFQTSTAVNTPFFNGDKTRYFSLQSNSITLNGYLHGAGAPTPLMLTVYNDYTLDPFIGAGIGVSFNEVSNFHSVKTDGAYVAIEQAKSATSMAWQLSAGLQLVHLNRFSMAVGYRYYNGGDFFSNEYTEISLDYHTPWKGVVQANEFFVTCAYKIDA